MTAKKAADDAAEHVVTAPVDVSHQVWPDVNPKGADTSHQVWADVADITPASQEESEPST